VQQEPRLYFGRILTIYSKIFLALLNDDGPKSLRFNSLSKDKVEIVDCHGFIVLMCLLLLVFDSNHSISSLHLLKIMPFSSLHLLMLIKSLSEFFFYCSG
jgi:hypothetical protein